MPEGGSSWFKYGCLGCLAIVAIMLVLVAVLFGVAWLGVEAEQVADRSLTPAIPATTAVPEPGAGGRVRIEVRDAELTLEPAAAGEPLHVEASYDTNSFKLEEKLEGAEGSSSWTYELTFERTGSSGALSGIRALLGGSQARLRVFLPADVPIELDLAMEQGGATLRLGGLWLTSGNIEFSKGGLDLSVDEPLREPMEHLSVRCSMGGAALSRIGNASPRRLDVDYSMGGMSLDLRGLWLSDSQITINGAMGGGAVRLPPDVILSGLNRGGGIEAPVEGEVEPPTLTFSTSSSMGELEFYD